MKYKPHDYQDYAAHYIKTHPIAALLLDMGLGKTVTTLTAIFDLLFDSFEISKVLIVAPLRVARHTWPQEIEKWEHLGFLKYSVAVGTEAERLAALNAKADIYIINRENVAWLVNNSRLPFDYDMLVVDELSSFKSHQSMRFKALMKARPKVRRIVGLTGTPSSNGLMDLYAEFKLLDMGERLGRFIGQYRTRYFKPGRTNGYIVYSYIPLPGAEEAIYDKISDITISMKATDHLKMPELISSEYMVELSEKEHEELKTDTNIQRWNAGKIAVGLIHPASAGHGLNLQSGGSTLVWFGLTWSLELYQQTNARLWRQGQTSATVVIQHVIVKGTVDEQILKALEIKDTSQAALIAAVKANLEV